MSGFALREYRAGDVSALSALWYDCFGDSEGFIKSFFDALPALGGGIVAHCGEEIAGAAYALCCQTLIGGGSERRAGYIYGVGVNRRFRSLGIGAALTRAACTLSKRLGAEIVATLPAEESLYGWYEKTAGLSVQLYRERRAVECASLLPVTPLTATDYSARRETLLHDTVHLRLTDAAAEFEGALLREYGGGYFAVSDGAAAVCMEDGRAVIKELLCPCGSIGEAAASLGAHLSAREALLFLPAERGEKYIAADTSLPSGCIWGLSFD